MSEDSTVSGEAFDLEKLRELILLMEQHGLSEIDLRGADRRWKLRRGPSEVLQMVPAAPYTPHPGAVPGPVMAPVPAAPPAAVPDENTVPIKSPTVGTFYEATAPGDEAFVKVGSRVSPDTVVCIIEAMKVFNQIPSEVNGTITSILVKNGDAVEFGQPLFMVKLGS